MIARHTKAAALWIILASLGATLGCSPSALSVHTAAPRAVAARVEQGARIERSVEKASEAGSAEQAETTAPSKRVVRRIKGSEMSVAVVKKARSIINEHYKKPFGFEVEFEIDGKRFVGRIEPHYHPPGGALRPWGHHHGCSLYVVEQG